MEFKKIELLNSEEQEFNSPTITDFKRLLLRLETTNNCNFKCNFCPHPDMKRKKGYMDEAVYRSVIDQAASLGVEKLDLRNFGEPILDKRLGDLARYANSKGLNKIYIHTNGYGLSKKILNRWGEGGITDVNISLSPKREFGMSRPGVNVEKMFSCLERVMKSDSPWKHILSVDYLRTGISSKEEEEEFFQWLKKYNLVKRIDIDLHNWAEGTASKFKQCHRLWTSVTVLWDGQVSLCCLDYEGEINLGNVLETPLKDIINSEAYRKIRHNHTQGLFLNKCAKCDMVEIKDFGPKPIYSKID
jgi:radical SAM protein with 4Fe4S-binding SPASM domain